MIFSWDQMNKHYMMSELNYLPKRANLLAKIKKFGGAIKTNSKRENTKSSMKMTSCLLNYCKLKYQLNMKKKEPTAIKNYCQELINQEEEVVVNQQLSNSVIE
ncbi:hypothetical protein Glove_423g14 [Diversispora epigaea]|uniref:Uncharacterized protein n=1 Tax=Diversispora epigaea TaxID=1348612 RepID=A0A397GZ38_9GLOM|nr:hypothetical protein Glove_423g14 [Diversispora epigaea]